MTLQEFTEARDLWKVLLEQQPNLFGPISPSEDAGKYLAETMWGFIEKFTQLKKTKVQ